MERALLEHMANQIAGYYAGYGDEEGANGVCAHILRFWSPPLRAQLLQLAADPTNALAPLVRAAAARLRAGSDA